MQRPSGGHAEEGSSLPIGARLVGFDEGLKVAVLSPAAEAQGVAGLGIPLARAIGVAPEQEEELEAAARAALSGASATLMLRRSADRGQVIVHLGPDREEEGVGAAVWFEPDLILEGGAERERSEELEQVAVITRSLARSQHLDEARAATCEGILAATRADCAVLFEPAEDGASLEATASVGVDAASLSLPIGESSGPAMAMRLNTARYAGDTSQESGQVAAGLAGLGIAAALWQPVARGRTVSAVVMLGWWQASPAVEPRITRMAEFVSVEAAVALDRGRRMSRLVSLAKTDSLTSLPNRIAWEDAVKREMARARRSGKPLTVAMLDLDDFKGFNERRGRASGDRALIDLASAWADQLRGGDLLVRWAGDDFGLVLPECALAESLSLFERLRDPAPEEIQFSAAAACWDAYESMETLTLRLEEALRRAKREGSPAVVSAG